MRAITHHFCPIITIMEYFHDLYEMMHGLKYIQYGCLNISHQIIDKNHKWIFMIIDLGYNFKLDSIGIYDLQSKQIAA